MSKFQSAIGTISALVTISVTVGTVYYNFENKKSQDVTQQEQINQLQQKLNESAPVVERPSDTYEAAPEPEPIPKSEPTLKPEPTIPTPPELPIVQSNPQLPSPPAPPAPPAPPVAQIQSVEIK